MATTKTVPMPSDAEECEVWCQDCNARLYHTSIYDPISRGKNISLIPCPHKEKCEEEIREAAFERYGGIPLYH